MSGIHVLFSAMLELKKMKLVIPLLYTKSKPTNFENKADLIEYSILPKEEVPELKILS